MSDCNSVDCSPPGSSVHGISQTRILEWVAIFSFRGSSQPRDWSCVSCMAGGFFFFFLTTEPLWSPWETLGYIIFKISFSFRVACFCECTKSHWIIHFKRKEFSPNCYIKIFSWLLNFQNCDYLAFLLFTIYFLFLVGKTHIPVCPIDILYRKGHSVLGKVFTFLIMASICSSHLNLCGY